MKTGCLEITPPDATSCILIIPHADFYMQSIRLYASERIDHRILYEKQIIAGRWYLISYSLYPGNSKKNLPISEKVKARTAVSYILLARILSFF